MFEVKQKTAKGTQESEEQADRNDHQDDERANESPLDEEEQGEEEYEEEEEIGELDRYWPPPVDQTVKIVASPVGKTVSAFAFNNAGTRFAAGGHDHEVRIWDFKALDPNQPEPIGTTQPCGQVVIKHLEFSNDDELILVISGSCQAVVMAKDGSVNGRKVCTKGDQYLADMSQTKGHVQMLNDGSWMPKDKSTFITCSNDATIRIWDLNNVTQQKTVIKTRSPVNGLKSVPNVCRFSRDSLSIVAGCNDGSIMFWDTRRKFISTSDCIKSAHLKGSEITGLDYNYGMNKLCTRSEDESCKIWDLRQLKQALVVRSGLPSLYPGTDCSFSPDDKFVVTGTSASKSAGGQLQFLDSLELASQNCVEVPLSGASVIRSSWHAKINHLGYSCNQGCVWLAYDARRSAGAGCCLMQSWRSGGTKRKRYVSGSTGASGAIKRIVTPHALPMFRESPGHGSGSFAKIRQDPRRSYKPEMPAQGVGGTVRAVGSTLSSYIARNIARPLPDESLSIRDRILRHASHGDGAAAGAGPAAEGRPSSSGPAAIGGPGAEAPAGPPADEAK